MVVMLLLLRLHAVTSGYIAAQSISLETTCAHKPPAGPSAPAGPHKYPALASPAAGSHSGACELARQSGVLCHAWHAASVLSIRSINFGNCRYRQATALSAYLQANADVSAVDSITAEGNIRDDIETLALPTAKPTALSSLHLVHLMPVSVQEVPREPVQAAAEPEAEAEAAAEPLPLIVSELSALTSLELIRCKVQLQGIGQLTALQRLALHDSYSSTPPDDATDSFPASVAALPQLQQLTYLQLVGQVCREPLLAHLSTLTRLQELTLGPVDCQPSGFSNLPASLVALSVAYVPPYSQPMGDWDFQEPSPSISTAGWLQGLTALEKLTVGPVC